MDQQPKVSPGDGARGESDRVRLARLARETALRVPGVVGTSTSPLGVYVTAAGDGERLEGVTCVSAAGGGYAVSLRLVCDLVPLPSLGERVRTAVGRAAAMADAELDSVSVHFAELAAGGER